MPRSLLKVTRHNQLSLSLSLSLSHAKKTHSVEVIENVVYEIEFVKDCRPISLHGDM